MRHSIAALCVCAVFVVFICAATHAFAQAAGQAAETQAAPKNSLVKGAWALQFKVDSDAILSEFGGSVAIKRHISAQSAFRVGFDYGLSTADRDREDLHYDNDIGTIGMFIDYLRYADVASPVHFFWGVGPFGSFYRNKTSLPSGTPPYETINKSWDVGISGRIGVEWFFTRTLSLHAEYFGTAYYESRTSEFTSTVEGVPNTTKASDDQWALSRGPVVFGLSAYF